MAIFIPSDTSAESFHNSTGEMRVYSALEKLPDSYIVFCSLKWGKTSNNGKSMSIGESDFLVYAPHRGLLAIEVKAGGIRRTSNGDWYSIGHDGEYHLKQSPLEQAWACATRFAELLKSSSNSIIGNYRVSAAVWFPSIANRADIAELPSEYQYGNTFVQIDLDDPERAIERAFEYYGSNFYEEPNKEIKNAVIQAFSPELKIVPGLASEINDQKYFFSRLTNEQATLLDYLEEQKVACIQGVGGTGKTMLALERARRMPDEEKVLFLCFNKFLLGYLRQNYSAEMPNVAFTSLNAWRANTLHTSEIAEPEEITDFLENYYNYGFDYDHIIIDEAQDFNAKHLNLLYDVAKLSGGFFYAFYDKNQLVHQWETETLKWFKSLDCHLILHKNCRNTFQIASTAYASVGIEEVSLAKHINGDKPIMENYANSEAVLEAIGNTIRKYTDSGYNRKQITILTLKTLTKSILAGKNSIGGYRITTEPEENGILFTTARKFKGLETDVAIIIDIDAETFKDDNNKCVFYVASSRAKHSITYLSNLSEDGMKQLCLDLGINKSGSAKRLLSEALSIDIINN